MSKKKDKEAESFDLNIALSNVNRYLKAGFIEYIDGEKVTSQRQFDKLYKEYKEFR